MEFWSEKRGKNIQGEIENFYPYMWDNIRPILLYMWVSPTCDNWNLLLISGIQMYTIQVTTFIFIIILLLSKTFHALHAMHSLEHTKGSISFG